MRRGLKKGIFLLGGILLLLLLFEAVLQVASYLNIRAAWESENGSTAPPGTRVVLCIGDSFTFGAGASTKGQSYPGQLEKLLNGEAKNSWRVVNKGWPGLNSAELLQRTPAFLEEAKPDHVLILIGRNNRWNRAEMNLPPPSLDGGERRASGWEWKLRTVRFLAILWANVTEPAATSREGGRWQGLKEADRLLRDGELEAARKRLEELRPKIRGSDDRLAAVNFTELLYRLHDHEAIVEECLFHVEKHGPCMSLCFMLVKPLNWLGRREEALHWAHEAFDLLEPGQSPVPIYRARAQVHLAMDQDLPALKDMLEAYAVHRNDGLLEDDLRTVSNKGRKRLLILPELVKAMPLDAGLKERALETAFAVVTRMEHEKGGSDFSKKLEHDLEHIIALVDACKAKPMLLTYPQPVREVEAVIRAVAGRTGTVLVDMIPAFTEILEKEDRWHYFIDDGHCTDAGYGVMSRCVAEVLN